MTDVLVSSAVRARRRRVGNIVLLLCGAVGGVTLLALLAMTIWTLGRGLADLGGTLGRRDDISDAFISAFTGSIVVSVVATFGSIAVGVGAGIYVSEAMHRPRLARWIFGVVQSLASLPSVVFGVVGMRLVSSTMQGMPALLAASVTLSLIAIPRVMLATRDSLSQVPDALRDASYALGATRLQTVRYHILPLAIRGIAGGVLTTMARTFGATAPLVMLGLVMHGEDAWPTLPATAMQAMAGGGRSGAELAGAAVAVVVMVHVAITLWAASLQRRFRTEPWS
jgi:phosphate transport system permease protein